jgi:excisionase family DNA binding protein
MPIDQYQTVQELAERLEVSEATIRQWIKSGELRAIDIGKGWRIANTDLAHFLKARETAPRNETSAPVSIRPDRNG